MENPTTTINLLVTCDLAQVTQEGKLSILGIFERISADNVPIIYPRFFIVGIISGEPNSEHRIQFSITDPDGNDMIQQYQVAARLGYDGNANVLNDLVGTTFSRLGKYTITMYVDNIIEKSSTILVTPPYRDPMATSKKIKN